MRILTRKTIALYVDRSSQDWVAQDQDGNFWLVPADDRGWDHRRPLQVADENQLEPVPGHYRQMLGIPA